MAGFSKPLQLGSTLPCLGPITPPVKDGWFRLFPFRSPLLRESLLISFPRGTKMFQFPPFAPPSLCIQEGDTQGLPEWVAPFGNLRVNGYLRLTEAYRSLSRPSSPADAKASPMCPCSLPTTPLVFQDPLKDGSSRPPPLQVPCIQHWKPKTFQPCSVLLLFSSRRRFKRLPP